MSTGGEGGTRQEGIFQRQPFMPLGHTATPSRLRHEGNQAPRDRRSHARLPKSGLLAGSLLRSGPVSLRASCPTCVARGAAPGRVGMDVPPMPCARGAAAGGQDPLPGSLLPSRAHCAFLRGHEAGGSPHCRESLGRRPPQGLPGLQGTTVCSPLRPPHLSVQGTNSSLFSSSQGLNNPTHYITAQIPF